MEFWLDNPNVLFQKQIVPTTNMTPVQQLNAIARFSLIFMVLVYLLKGDMRWMSFSATLLILTVVFRNNIQTFKEKSCHHKTPNNPFGNFNVGDYYDNPARLATCPDSRETALELAQKDYKYQDDVHKRQQSLMNFYTLPVTRVVNDQIGFAKFLMGTHSGKCKTNGEDCLVDEDPRFHRGRYFNGNQ